MEKAGAENLLFNIPAKYPDNTCKDCIFRSPWQCGGTVIQYCAKRGSNRTESGMLKIKCKTPACELFEKHA